KVYCFFSKSTLTLVVGSANLTTGGMQNNVELSSVHRMPLNSKAARAIIVFQLKIDKVVKLADTDVIADYRRRYNIYRPRVEAVEKEAKTEVKKLCQLNLEKVRSYLNQYRDAGKVQTFKKRLQRYKQAREVLTELADRRTVTSSLFRARYDALVGGGKQARLW